MRSAAEKRRFIHGPASSSLEIFAIRRDLIGMVEPFLDLRQGSTYARVTRRSSSGVLGAGEPGEVSRMHSIIYIRGVPGLPMLTNHSASGGTALSRENSADFSGGGGGQGDLLAP